jgi:hypothetical protein
MQQALLIPGMDSRLRGNDSNNNDGACIKNGVAKKKMFCAQPREHKTIFFDRTAVHYSDAPSRSRLGALKNLRPRLRPRVRQVLIITTRQIRLHEILENPLRIIRLGQRTRQRINTHT